MNLTIPGHYKIVWLKLSFQGRFLLSGPSLLTLYLKFASKREKIFTALLLHCFVVAAEMPRFVETVSTAMRQVESCGFAS